MHIPLHRFESIAKTNTTYTFTKMLILILCLRVLLKQIQHTQIKLLNDVTIWFESIAKTNTTYTCIALVRISSCLRVLLKQIQHTLRIF